MRDEILNLKPQLVAEGNLEASHIIPNSVFIKCYSLNAYEYFSFSQVNELYKVSPLGFIYIAAKWWAGGLDN